MSPAGHLFASQGDGIGTWEVTVNHFTPPVARGGKTAYTPAPFSMGELPRNGIKESL